MRKIFFLRKDWLVITGITCIGLLLRLYKLDQWSFHVDEVATVYHTIAFPEKLTINPIIYLFMWLWKELFGINEFRMRFIPSMIGVITIPIFYLPMKKIFNRRSALVACALISLSPWHLFWSQFARYYTLVFLLGGITAFCFYFALERNSLKLLLSSIFLAGLTTLSHTPSLLLFPAMAFYIAMLYVLPIEKPEGLNRRNFVIVILTNTLPFVAFLIPGFLSYLISGWTIQTWGGGSIYVLMSLIYRLGIPTCLISLLSLVELLRKKDRRGIFLMSFVLSPLVIILCGSMFANIAAYYLFYTIPLYFLLAGYGAARLFDSQKAKTLSLSIILILMFSFIAEDFLYFAYQNGGRAKWREAFYTICRQKDKSVARASRSDNELTTDREDPIVVAPTIMAEYYLNETCTEDEKVKRKIIPLSEFQPQTLPRYDSSYSGAVWFVIHRQSLRTDAKRKLYRWILAHCQLVAEYPIFFVGPKNETINVFLYHPQE